jgi:pyruvate/2-oxoglutarate dehydrogenase complex dihydrolipoamide dehydrogenase (E3) component
MMKTLDYDLLAIGGGTAGLVSAAGAAYLGARAGLVEREALGGDEILVAAGRRRVTDRLELDRGGIETVGTAVRVNKKLRTTARGV